MVHSILHLKGLTGQRLDCAHPLVFDNGAPISWANSIMNVYDLRHLNKVKDN